MALSSLVFCLEVGKVCLLLKMEGVQWKTMEKRAVWTSQKWNKIFTDDITYIQLVCL